MLVSIVENKEGISDRAKLKAWQNVQKIAVEENNDQAFDKASDRIAVLELLVNGEQYR